MKSGGSSPADARLDILRAIAVVLVVIHHGQQMYGINWSRLGHYGVLIFFVHTSLVLMMSMERMAARSRSIAVPFYIQRAFRIYPLSILCVLSMVALHIPASHTDAVYVKPDVIRLISNLLLIQNWGAGQVLDPLWSLPFEIQMYVVLPFIFLFLARFRRGGAMAALFTGSIILGSLQFVSYYGKIAEFFPCFMAGVYAFWLRGRQRVFIPSTLWPLLILALAGFYMAVSFPGDAFLVCLGLGLAAGRFRVPSTSWWTMGAHQIAKYSYGIYLVHEPLYWACFYHLKLGSQAAKWLLFLVLVCAVPFALYHGIEAPMIRVGKRLSERWQTAD